ncbi:DUF4251 domain-containing protein [Bacteroides sp. UBA939]|uniref:DUF4251 domain-containing protein n=1 Tax=Bacteroides sp. UBA939 TaxID=1946092 RepID=UPI0025B87558|nr:DUF4251 domain-containing protein [Bacteroides sp. UBA939]
MKTIRMIFSVLLIAAICIPLLSAQTKKEKKEQKQQVVKELIMSEAYKIDVDRAFPTRGRSITLTSPYSIEIRNDSVISYLPYFGRAYSIPYGGGDGLNFKAPLNEYQMEWNKKGTAKIKFTARNTEDNFEFSIDIYDNGLSSIHVNMKNRESINFQGELFINNANQ